MLSQNTHTRRHPHAHRPQWIIDPSVAIPLTRYQTQITTVRIHAFILSLIDGKRWRAWDLFEELDRLTGTEVFRDVYRENVHARNFPDMSVVYEELGLASRRGRIRMLEEAPLLRVRDDIMSDSGTMSRMGSAPGRSP